MKKLLFVLLFVTCAAKLHAANDQMGSQRPAVWRSSVTMSNDTGVVISSVPVILHAVTVDTPGATSSFEAFDTHGITTSGRIIAPLDTTSKNGNQPWNVIMSSGLTYSTSGGTPAKITILWDYVQKPTWVR